MSYIAYYSVATEYESGWGCRPDGYLVCLNKDYLQEKINKVNSYQGQEFTRCEEPKLCLINEEMYAQLVKNEGFVWTGNKTDWKVEG